MAKGNEPTKHPVLVKNTLKKIFDKGDQSKKPDETHVQHLDRQKTDRKPKVEAKIEEKRKEPSKQILGEHTERIIKQRDKDE